MTSEIPYSQFIEMLENGEVESVVLRSDTLTITLRLSSLWSEPRKFILH